MDENIKRILAKYSSMVETKLNAQTIGMKLSKHYLKFKSESMPVLGWYERACKRLGRFVKLRVSEKDKARLVKHLEIAHLNVTPEEALGLSFFMFLASFLFFTFIFIAAYMLVGFNTQLLLIMFLGIIFGLVVFNYFNSMPAKLAQSWRLKASSQMVPCILYIVVYMRHTSNLERAILFASEHLPAPLALDLKKIFWDVEIGKYATIKQSLDAYLETWRNYADEFIEAFHLIESSLFEPSEARRIEILEKALQVMLDGVYDKMLKYSHDVKAPLNNLYMLGIVLPTLGLALLPLASTLLQGMLRWYHVFILFNLLFPFFVFYLTQKILSKRPGGFGETSLLEQNPNYKYFISKAPWFKAAIVAFPLLVVAFIPFIFYFTPLPDVLGIARDPGISTLPALQKFFDFKQVDSSVTGPFGLVALLCSISLPLAIAMFFSIAFTEKTKKLIKTREQTKKLEQEFASALFQLGNRLGDGIPAEIAFGKVAVTTTGTATGEFFKLVNTNIQQFGMSLENALFHPTRGAIIFFPSDLVRTSMKILVEAVKKGLKTAARAMISISQYVKNIDKINQRLKDLLADITTSMKSNMTFLAPVLAAIVVGLASMITTILNHLQNMIALGQLTETQQLIGGFTAQQILQLFNVSTMIPPYFLQIIVGLYLIEIIFILSQTLVTIENGVDKLAERYEIARNLRFAILLYTFTALISIIALTLLASVAVGGLAG